MNMLGNLPGMNMLGNMPGMNMLGNLPGMNMLGNMPGMSGMNLNLGINLNFDSTNFSQGLGDQYSGIGNSFGGMGMGNMGFGSVPGFGGSCNQMGSMYGGMMQGLQQQQQMMMMMMMMMMQMMQQQQMQMMQGMMNGMGGGFGSPVNMGSGATGGASGATGGTPTPNGGASTAVGWAQKFVGQDSASIKGKLPSFTAAGGRNNNCADFVSSCLENAGMLKGHEINVKHMEQSLKKQGWVQVSREQAQPGDVCMNASRGHVELVEKSAAQNGGKVGLIGSNNGGDSIQEITRDNYTGNQAGAVFYHKP